MKHQLDTILRSRDLAYFGHFFEQGCGKTYTALAEAEYMFLQGRIDAMVVIAPKGVHTNWVRREIPEHMSIPVRSFVWRGPMKTKKAKAQWEAFLDARRVEVPLRVFAINIDAFNTKDGKDTMEKFLAAHRCLVVVDESTRIKNPQAKRAKAVCDICRDAPYKRILTGTPVTRAPLDLYMQFHFLKPGLLGTKSYRAFVSTYAHLVPENSPKMRAIMAKTQARFVPQVVDTDEDGNPKWKDLDKLVALLAPHVSRVRKVDCLDLPPKVRDAIYFEMSASQAAVYDRLRDECEFATDLECHSFEAIAARAKMKQVTSGFVHISGEPVLVAEGNPRMDALEGALDSIEEGEQIIIWAIFQEEIKHLQAVLERRGLSFATYVGATTTADREEAIDQFQAGKVQVFLANPQAAGIGLTLTAASTAIYYSCGWDLELRLQSEDRAHRIGQKKTVRYIDLIALDSIDEDVLNNLSRKANTATNIIDNDILLGQ